MKADASRIANLSILCCNTGSQKSVLVFDMEGYSDPKTVMPDFMVSWP